jgi:acyl-CoA thioesterase
MKALTLMPRALAAWRTCFASRSSREIVVLMMHLHNLPSSMHQWYQHAIRVPKRFAPNGWLRSLRRSGNILESHAGVTGGAFSPDGRTLAGGDWDNTGRLRIATTD